MTSTTIGALRTKVSEVASDLYEARNDAVMFERLKNAAGEVKRLTAELSEAQSKLSRAEKDDEAARADARFKDFSDIHVTEVPDQHGGGLLRLEYDIAYTRKTWDGYATKDQKHVQRGFAAVPPDAIAYLIEKHPDRIPAKIMALAPNDPALAFSRYFIAKRRGYLIGSST